VSQLMLQLVKELLLHGIEAKGDVKEPKGGFKAVLVPETDRRRR